MKNKRLFDHFSFFFFGLCGITINNLNLNFILIIIILLFVV